MSRFTGGNLRSVAPPLADPISIAKHVYLESAPASIGIIHIVANNGATEGMVLAVDSSRVLSWGSLSGTPLIGPTLALNTWYYIAASRNGSAVALYWATPADRDLNSTSGTT